MTTETTTTAAPAGDTKAPAEAAKVAPVAADPKATAAPDPKVTTTAEVKAEAKPAEPEKKPERITTKIEELRKREVAVKERELKLATTEAEAKAVREELAQLKAMKGNPRALLTWGGFEGKAEEFAKALARNPEAAATEAKLEAFRKEVADKEARAAEQAQTAREAEQRVKVSGLIKQEIEAGGDALEFARVHGDTAVDDVHDALQAFYALHKKAPDRNDLKAIIKAVDAHYEQAWKLGAGTKRGKAHLVPAPEVKPDPAKVEAKPVVKPVEDGVKANGKIGRRPKKSEAAEIKEQWEGIWNKRENKA